MPQDFHAQDARPIAILFLLVGTVGLSAAWLFPVGWIFRVGMSVIFGSFMVFGGPAAFGGGRYRSWFADGRVYWTYPSRFYGRNDSCRVGDVVEFQHVTGATGGNGGGIIYYQLVLRDGTIKYVPPVCVGEDEGFYRALLKENQSVGYVRLQK